MKKKQKENFNLQLKRGFITVILGLLFVVSSTQLIYAKNAIKPQLTEEAKILFDREKQWFNARMNVDWEKMHSLQHPEFRKKVSVTEMLYFEGWAASDYREKAKQNAHISGAYVPSVDYMKKNIYKPDPLGFPVKRRYEWSGDPYITIKTFSLEKISISLFPFSLINEKLLNSIILLLFFMLIIENASFFLAITSVSFHSIILSNSKFKTSFPKESIIP